MYLKITRTEFSFKQIFSLIYDFLDIFPENVLISPFLPESLQ